MTNQFDPTESERKNAPQIFHPRFAALYERYACSGSERRFTDPLREETAGQAAGIVLEVGAGTGLNFRFYRPERIERVEAIEPDAAMLTYPRAPPQSAPLPITFTQPSIAPFPFPPPPFA